MTRLEEPFFKARGTSRVIASRAHALMHLAEGVKKINFSDQIAQEEWTKITEGLRKLNNEITKEIEDLEIHASSLGHRI